MVNSTIDQKEKAHKVTFASKVKVRPIPLVNEKYEPCYSEVNKGKVYTAIINDAKRKGTSLKKDGINEVSINKLSKYANSDLCHHSKVDREVARRLNKDKFFSK